jgi:hypothetical protein
MNIHLTLKMKEIVFYITFNPARYMNIQLQYNIQISNFSISCSNPFLKCMFNLGADFDCCICACFERKGNIQN